MVASANGSIKLSGGTAEVYSPSQGDGDPLDADGGITISGATVLGVGNNAMRQTYGGTYVAFGGGSGGMGGMSGGWGGSGQNIVTAGGAIEIKDASGNVLYSASAVRNAGYVVFASPSLTSGSTYYLYVNGVQVSSAAAGISSSGGGFGPGRWISGF